jgi:predicted DNA-binding antitoxin AbrB/MazE fold protein
MSIIIEATYEDGVLKPSQPLPFSEHQKVRLTVQPQQSRTDDFAKPAEEGSSPSLAEQLIALANAVPEEVVSQWPRDGASQHDHYIYGTPKRPDLPE